MLESAFEIDDNIAIYDGYVVLMHAITEDGEEESEWEEI